MQAINWAVEECDADIISLSFGFEEDDETIDIALEDAARAGKLVIAAASNRGGRSDRARPARREDVICIHATDGNGSIGGRNPPPLPQTDNFATLGVAVPSRWKHDDVWNSGTSFAVPIAAGFAADVLTFARLRCDLTPRRMEILHQKRGMQAIFRVMSRKRDGYDFIHPHHLWKDGEMIGNAARRIENVLLRL